MDLIDRITELSSRIPKLREDIKTEEATKTSLIMPFIQALGYDIFNPKEVVPEFIADVGTKKGEKVDYAILRDGKPIILFECKAISCDLSQVHASQLYRYFSVTAARFSILTNGVEYQFYSDLEEQNKMDDKPFLVFDLTETAKLEQLVKELKKFTKSAFDVDQILTTASKLKYSGAVKRIFIKQL